jgi:hypothetical protein
MPVGVRCSIRDILGIEPPSVQIHRYKHHSPCDSIQSPEKKNPQVLDLRIPVKWA